MSVIAAPREFQLLAENHLDGSFIATKEVFGTSSAFSEGKELAFQLPEGMVQGLDG